MELKTDCTISLDKSVYSCEAEKNLCPSFGFLSNLDNGRHIKHYLSLWEPHSYLSRRYADGFHLLTLSPVHTWPALACSVNTSFICPNHRCFLWQMDIQEPWLRWICQYLTVDHGCHSWCRMKQCNLAPVMKSIRSLCSRVIGLPKLLAVPTTLPLSLGHRDPCAP